MKYRIGWILVAIGLFAIPVMGQSTINPVKRIDVSSLTLQIEGDTLYVGGSDKLRIYDISDRANPVFQGDIAFDSSIVSIAVVGNIVVVGTVEQSDPNLMIVDVSNPKSPKLLFERRTDQDRKLLQVLRAMGRYIFIGLDDVAIQVVELDQNNDIKQIIGSLSMDSVITDIKIQGNRAFVSTWYDVQVVDISDPTNLRVTKVIPTDDANNGLSIDGNLMAVTEAYTGVTFYDISNPDNPKKINTVFISRNNEIYRIALRQEFCYISMFFGKMEYLDFNGGLRILDYQNLNSIKIVYSNDDPANALDVLAYDGYVYVAEDMSFSVFKHGPIGVRPTATPVIPTNTPTPTHTPTPTNTPPLLVTPTPTPPISVPPTDTPIPVPTNTHTPTFTPTHTPLPSAPTPTMTPILGPTNTPIPAQPTSTPGSSSGGLPSALFTADFEGPLLAHEQFVAQLPFAGSFTQAQHQIGSIPTDNAFTGATNGRGLSVTLEAGQALMLMGPYLSLDPNTPALIRVSVRSTGGGVSVALASLDGSFDGSLATNIPADSAVFNGAYKRMTMVYKAPSNGIIPILQASAGASLSGPVTIYFDNFELIPLPAGSIIPAEALGADGTAP